MTKSGLFSKLAAILAALAVVFLPEEVFIDFLEEIVWFCVIINIILAVTGWEFPVVFTTFYGSFLKRIAKVVITHQIIGLGEKGIDAVMIFLILSCGAVIEYLIIVPIYFLYCIFIVWAYDYFLEKGHDLLELENLRVNGGANRVLKWILRRRVAIFLIGSFYQLDPDGVTILLRKNRGMFWRNSFSITLPSVLVSITIWTTVYALAIKGYEWFKWAVE